MYDLKVLKILFFHYFSSIIRIFIVFMKKISIAGTFLYFLFASDFHAVETHLNIQENDGKDVIFHEQSIKPLFTGSGDNILLSFTLNCNDTDQQSVVEKIVLIFSRMSAVSGISSVNVFSRTPSMPESEYKLFGSSASGKEKIIIKGDQKLAAGENKIIVRVSLREDADLLGKLKLDKIRIMLDDGSQLALPDYKFQEYRFAKKLRTAGQDNCNTYRIPGLITTNAGTLIAVYDNRYNGSKDLQEDIDIGMSRTTDGGQTWEPMKVIIDMGEYGGRSQKLNGTGDPCILYDHITNTIWVAALWMSGSGPDQMLWWESKPGMSPEETGQFVLVKSTDDGVTWSAPYTITGQIKDPAWQLLLQGPGRGITMKDGTLVFPAQFKADIGEKAIDGGRYTCHSTIVYSRDAGNTWHIGTGAKTNTTEAQVVELSDGSLMLNMRDDSNRKDITETNGRAVSTTSDLGATWVTHSSSNHSLPEPNCMASIISADLMVSGKMKKVLFFSNPDNKTTRSDMTIKASLDEGVTWPAGYSVLLNHDEGYGYSCLTMVDENTVAILYEGVKELYFQKIPVRDIILTGKK